MEKIKKIVNVIYNIIIYGLIIIILFYLCIIGYNKVFKKESLPSINNYYLFQIASGSMENKLKSGDYIIVKKTNKYKKGDIITYKEDDYYITHRVKEIKGDNIIAKGDANDTEDEPIKKSDILGKYVMKAYILTFISNNKIIFLILLAIWFIFGIFSKKKEA